MLDLEALLEMAHAAADETAALDAVCQFVCERLRAATVQIVTGPPEPRMLARAGRPWQGDSALVTRAFAGAARAALASPIADSGEPRQAAEPIRFGREAIAVLVLPMDPRRRDRRATGPRRSSARGSARRHRLRFAAFSIVRRRSWPIAAFSELLGVE